jgi:4-amino-4-deoxy-L-arabinose transferase-like glycosyltransferase
MLILIFWMTPQLGNIGFPLVWGHTPHQFSEGTRQLVLWSGRLLTLAGLLPWLWLWASPDTFPQRGRAPLAFWWLSIIGMVLWFLPSTWYTWPATPPEIALLANPADSAANDQQLLLYFGALGCFVIGMMRPTVPRQIGERLWRSFQQQRWEWLLVGLLTLAALALRLYDLDKLFPIMVSDEPPYLARASEIATGSAHYLGQDRLFGEMNLGAHWIALMLRATGVSLFNARLLAVIVGSLTIIPLYLLVRRMTNPLVAVLACLFLMTQPLHFHFSRMMMSMVFDPLMGLWAIWLIWDGMERGGRWKFALAGVLIGLAQYFYVGSRIWLVLIPLWWGIMILRQPRSYWRTRWGGVIFVAGVLLAMTPLLTNAHLTNVSPFSRQMEMASDSGEDTSQAVFDRTFISYLTEDLHTAIRAFYDFGDRTEHFDETRSVAVNLQWAFIVVALGAGYAVRFAPDSRLLFFLLWLGLMTIFGGSLPRDTPGFSRYLNATPALAILGAVGVYWVGKALLGWLRPPYQQYALACASLAAMLWVGYGNIDYMWRDHAPAVLERIGVGRYMGDALGKLAADKASEPDAKIIWAIDPYGMYDLRYSEIYIFYHGQADIEEVTEPIREEWLYLLDTQNYTTYLFIAPRPYSLDQTTFPILSDHPSHLLLAAFPGATFTTYDQDQYDFPTTRRFPLYSLVTIPKGTPYCDPACRAANPG